MLKLRKVGAAIAGSLLLAATLAACGSSDDADKAEKSAPKSTMDPALAALTQASPDFMIAPFHDEVTGERMTPGAEGKFQLPGGTVSLTSITLIDSVFDDSTGEDVRAADNEQLLVVQLEEVSDDRFGYTRPSVQLLMEDSGKRTNLSEGSVSGSYLLSASPDAQLVLAVDGRDFRAPLGEDNRGTVEAAARVGESKQDLAQLVNFKTVTLKAGGEKQTFAFSHKVDSVTLTQFLPSELHDGTSRWAEDGKAFIIVQASGGSVVRRGDYLTYEDTYTRLWSVEANDTTYKALRPMAERETTAVIEVPADTKTFALNATAKTDVIPSWGSKIKGAKTLNHGSYSIEVEFP